MDAPASHWILPVYGGPDASSEVNRVGGFYRAEALAAFGPAVRAEEAGAAAPGLDIAASMRAVAQKLVPQPDGSAAPA